MKYIYGQMETNEIDGKKEVEKEYATGWQGRSGFFVPYIFLFNQLFYVIPFSLVFLLII